MARVKLSEYKTKQLLFAKIDKELDSVAVTTGKPLREFDKKLSYVVKVDQGVKKRFKNGLVKLGVLSTEIETVVQGLSKKGFSHFIVEPFITYSEKSERYLSFERIREGIRVAYSLQGGVDIESHPESVETIIVTSLESGVSVAKKLGISDELFNGLLRAFDEYYFSFLEINPLVVIENQVYFLDAAGEVDSCAEFFVREQWTALDFVEPPSESYVEEEAVRLVAQKSQAALTLKVLQPNGSVFLLLSGGGASIVLADELYDLGWGREIANYGEYSGNPSTEETYLYTHQLLSLLLKSKAKKKVLIIAGGVANFTDIRHTFKGIIQALDEVSEKLQKQNVAVFARRGGPYQEEGLRMMKESLERRHLLGAVCGPEVVLTDVVKVAVDHLQKG